jgi:hypothetical protein
VFIYLFSEVPQWSDRRALQVVKHFLFINVLLIWIITFVRYSKGDELLNYYSEIGFIPGFYLLTIAQCLLLAVIFALNGTWIKRYKDKRIIKNHIIKQ